MWPRKLIAYYHHSPCFESVLSLQVIDLCFILFRKWIELQYKRDEYWEACQSSKALNLLKTSILHMHLQTHCAIMFSPRLWTSSVQRCLCLNCHTVINNNGKQITSPVMNESFSVINVCIEMNWNVLYNTLCDSVRITQKIRCCTLQLFCNVHSTSAFGSSFSYVSFSSSLLLCVCVRVREWTFTSLYVFSKCWTPSSVI